MKYIGEGNRAGSLGGGVVVAAVADVKATGFSFAVAKK